ncbi:DUF1552 domain-containing protein [Limnoglobus roseus]|uniref:DUF1552 domain-containing protein n=1 Tax=Limnoglobus roseus TaxID=2598579 RepID=A0A5C1ADH0_9BACT|nr:DUF1552 domain-containing protein [Limnoglobus roseus]QEL16046.1 hypothetical protein PX52LOC_02984 [Limnoglobus roseus]
MTMPLSRRTVLRGLGTAMALPLLDAMAPATRAADAARPPRRMAFLYVPNGAYMPYWMPKTEGADYELTPCLEPMAEHRKEMLVFGGLTCDKARANGDGAGDHARASGAFLTGAQPKKTAGANFQAGPSADQLAAQQLGDRTRLPSLEMAIEKYRGAGGCDSGYSCVYEHTLSWRNSTTPVPPEVNPLQVFNRLFASKPNDPDAAARNALRASVLDAVLEDAKDLDRKLGGSDRKKLDQYLSGVRELEQRIAKAERLSPSVLPDDVSRPIGVPADLTEHLRLMCDLMVLAFQTDSTRIGSFMLGREGSEQKYRMVGVNEGHHSISHHQNKADNLAKIKAINTYHMTQLAYLTGKLKAVKEGDGTLLDNCMIAYGSAIADPNRHIHHDLPVLLVGRGGGTIKTGRYVRYKGDTPLNNLWLAMLDRFGAKATKLGDSTAVLDGLG